RKAALVLKCVGYVAHFQEVIETLVQVEHKVDSIYAWSNKELKLTGIESCL
ncbi:hypothetical protein CERSUDRAFT_115231, partial [Gelatoporia subvermispora B]